jgi:hypothetical protein
MTPFLVIASLTVYLLAGLIAYHVLFGGRS